MRLISIITGGSAYPDRMRLLFALDPYVEQHVIIMHYETEIPELTNTVVIRPARRNIGLLFWPWAGMIATRIVLRDKSLEPWLLNEHFGCFASLIPRFLLRRRVKIAVSLYAPNRSLFMKEAWNIDPFAGSISPEQRRLYSKRYRGNMRLDQMAIRIADALIVNSENIREDILESCPGKQVIVMPTSVSLPEEITLAQYADSNPAITFLYVGKMQPIKGIAVLLEAFARFNTRRTGDRLIIVGGVNPADQNWFESLLSGQNSSGHVEYIPHLPPDQLIRKYQECDVFVFPSFFEGSPRVVKEAMVYGCPVIASDIPGTRLIDAEGHAIQYFPPGDADALAAAMQSLAENPKLCAELGQRSQRVVSEFSHTGVAKRLMQAYESILVAVKAGKTI
jgi:glycosyltransferase involved in cell wall biosynthesis